MISLISFLFEPVKVDSSFIFAVEVMIIIKMLVSVYTVFIHSIFNNLLYQVRLKDVYFGLIIVELLVLKPNILSLKSYFIYLDTLQGPLNIYFSGYIDKWRYFS